jgi:alpha-tubulin suppressor-like RCC1 family protein
MTYAERDTHSVNAQRLAYGRLLKLTRHFLSVALLFISVFGTAAHAVIPQITAGDEHTLALRTDGTVWAWGSNDIGQLGNGSFQNSSIPVQVPGLRGISGISASRHTLALKNDGTVWAWGGNAYGELGNGTTLGSTTPVEVPGLTGVSAISAGRGFSVALKYDGTVWTWGQTMPNSTYTYSTTPVQVNGLTDVTSISAGGGYSIALKKDGTVWGWGALGNGEYGVLFNSVTPVPISGLTNVAEISARYYQIAVLKNDGTVWFVGILGSLSPTITRPLQVGGLSGVMSIATGHANTLALKSDGTVWAWGNNIWGQLGNGQVGNSPPTYLDSTTPTQVLSLFDIAGIAGGVRHAAARRTDGTVWTWGDNTNGKFGNGTTVNASVPQQSQINLIAPLPPVTEFYNADLDHYFRTADADEANSIDHGAAGPSWIRTGNTFNSGGSTPACRFYGSQSPGPNSHFYTVDTGECAYLKQLQASTPSTQKRWNFESLDFESTPPVNGVCPSATAPVYRAYNNGFARNIDSNHRISSNLAAIQEVVARGWINEGVVMCAPL